MARTKKDFDKESMFSKIMPTAKAESNEMETQATPVVVVQEPAIPVSNALPVPSVVSNPHMNAITHGELGAIPRTHNIMEDVVFQKIDDVLTRFNCCKCELCRQDVIAIALNNLTPKYISANEEKISAKVQLTMMKSANDANAALVKAAIVVRNNPRH